MSISNIPDLMCRKAPYCRWPSRLSRVAVIVASPQASFTNLDLLTEP